MTPTVTLKVALWVEQGMTRMKISKVFLNENRKDTPRASLKEIQTASLKVSLKVTLRVSLTVTLKKTLQVRLKE